MTIQTPALGTADTLGAQVEAWSDVAEVWARVLPLGAVEQWKQKAVSPEASYEVTVRYHSDLTHACRFLWGTRYLYPLSVVEDEKHTQQRCLCREQL